MDRRFHLHGLYRAEDVARRHRLAALDRDRGNDAGHRRAELFPVPGLGLGADDDLAGSEPVRHRDAARLAVEIEEDAHLALLVGRRAAQILEHQRLALLDIDENLLVLGEAVEINGRRQRPGRPVAVLRLHELGEDLGVHEVRGEAEIVDLRASCFLGPAAFRFEVNVLEIGAGAVGQGLSPLEHLLLQCLGETAGRLTQIAHEEAHHGIREGDFAGRVLDVGPRQAGGDHGERHVAHDLGRGCHLHDIAEHLVDVGIGARHVVPARFETHRARLLLEVGELPARHFVQIDLGRTGPQIALEGAILPAHRLPIERDIADRRLVEFGIARSALERGNERAERGLAGCA